MSKKYIQKTAEIPGLMIIEEIKENELKQKLKRLDIVRPADLNQAQTAEKLSQIIIKSFVHLVVIQNI